MIITVTLNPALDKTAMLEKLDVGELNRLRNVIIDAGGKGINVSKMISSLGGKSITTGFIGGGSGDALTRALNSQNICTDFVRVNGNTRTNLKVLDQGNRLTELNEPGPEVTATEVTELINKINELAEVDSIFVLAGSLPQGVAKDIYATLIYTIHQKGAKVFLDADGIAFREALPAMPDFIKPNQHELSEYFSLTDDDIDFNRNIELCYKLLQDGIKHVLLTMGGDGAIFINGKDDLRAAALKVPVQSSVGAGDSFVGAFVYAIDHMQSWRDAASLALAASAGAVTTSGTKPPQKEYVEQLLKEVELHAISLM